MIATTIDQTSETLAPTITGRNQACLWSSSGDIASRGGGGGASSAGKRASVEVGGRSSLFATHGPAESMSTPRSAAAMACRCSRVKSTELSLRAAT
jgi:hypothetical protein